MLLTPDARGEPPRPQLKVGIYFWHPRAWDIHFWSGEDGVPTISFHNVQKTPAEACNCRKTRSSILWRVISNFHRGQRSAEQPLNARRAVNCLRPVLRSGCRQ
jgi:hypothetical protein